MTDNWIPNIRKHQRRKKQKAQVMTIEVQESARLREHRHKASQTTGAYCLPGPEMVALCDKIERLTAITIGKFYECPHCPANGIIPEPKP